MNRPPTHYQGEELRVIPLLGGQYFATASGKVISAKRGALRELSKVRRNNTMAVKAAGRPVSVNVAVCSAWHGPKPSPEMKAMHLNGFFDDDRADNLRWALQEQVSEKIVERDRHYIRNHGQSTRKLTDEQVRSIRDRLANGETQRAIARDFEVTPNVIHLIVIGRTYQRPAAEVA